MNLFSKAHLLFLKSALTRQGAFMSTPEVEGWLREQNARVPVKVSRCSFDQVSGWYYEKSSGRMRHESGKFFSIDGIRVDTTWPSLGSWEQPIINQPEIGYLGIITREINGVLHFLLQTKIEPGNDNHVQLPPTLQATRSNYTQVHKGREPLYLNYFRDARPRQILLDQYCPDYKFYIKHATMHAEETVLFAKAS